MTTTSSVGGAIAPAKGSRCCDLVSSVAEAYSAGAGAWATGPTRIYGRLAELLVDAGPLELDGRLALDLGSGTGAATRAASARGARVVAVDNALGMLRNDRANRPPAAVGDALALPFADDAFDVVVAAFALNHLVDPAPGVREAGRVTKAGGFVLASTYAADDDHPVKGAVERALAEAGWTCPPWYPELKTAMASWGTVEAATDAVVRGGLRPASVVRLEVPFPDLGAESIVAWRLGMAYCAPFVARLGDQARQTLERRALELLGADAGPLVRKAIFVVAGVG